jgi:multidrug efflux system membrane fusion protein
MSRKLVLITALLLATGGGYYYYSGHGAAQAAAPGGPPMAMPVSVAQVIERDVQAWHEYSGRVVAVDYVEIRSRVSGPIESINFKDGALVHKGDLLFTIDPRPYQAEVARTTAAVASAKAAADLSQTQFKRAESLIQDKAVSQSDYDTRKNEYSEAAAQVQSAEASLETAKLNLDYSQIRSPITGRVSRAEITAGNLIEAGASSPLLTTVVSQNPIYADFDIDEETYLKVAPETSGDVSKIAVTLALADGGKTYDGTMKSFDNKLNAQTGTLRARAVFTNDDGTLVPGLFARIRLGSAGTTKSILIDDKAVGTDQSKKFVYVVGDDNKVQYREIHLGDMAGSLRIITDGLHAGDKIIVDGLQRARPGAEVKPEIVDMEAPSGQSGAAPAAPPADATAPATDKATAPATDKDAPAADITAPAPDKADKDTPATKPESDKK